MNKQLTIIACTIGICAFPSHAAQTYSQQFTLTDPFGMNPARVQNAFLRTEPFGTPVRYWQPSTPNVWGEVVYRFDIPFNIDTASMFMSISAYSIGAPVNFDSGAQAYVDVSTDDLNYVNVLGAYANHYDNAGPGDITALVAGASVVFVRSRLFMTTDYGSFGTAQFLRGDPGATVGLTATAVPEPSGTTLILAGALAFLLFRLTPNNSCRTKKVLS
jgi:hypothetical protein